MTSLSAVKELPAGDLAMAVAFESGRAVVDVSGEVDLQTGPTMNALLRGLVEEGHHLLVLDLAGLTFMDASGLHVIVEVAERLARSAGELHVRSVPALTQRILDLTGVSGLLRFEAPVADEDHIVDASGPVGVVPETVLDEAAPKVVTPIADALAAREVIAQAQGIYMARGSVSADDAAAAIHRAARRREVSVLAESTDVVGAAETAPPADVPDPPHA